MSLHAVEDDQGPEPRLAFGCAKSLHVIMPALLGCMGEDKEPPQVLQIVSWLKDCVGESGTVVA